MNGEKEASLPCRRISNKLCRQSTLELGRAEASSPYVWAVPGDVLSKRDGRGCKYLSMNMTLAGDQGRC